MSSDTFDFFGATTRVHTSSRVDAIHLQRYYRDYLVSGGAMTACMFEVSLSSGSPLPFIDAMTDPNIVKTVKLRRGDDAWEVYETYTERPHRVTPIPPLLLRTDRQFTLTHASSFGVTGPDGRERVVIVRGNSGAGKSTLLLQGMAAGARFVSDDMTWMSDGHVFPFTRPIGVREGLARSLSPTLIDHCMAAGLSLITRGEVTHMVHVRDLDLPVLDKPAPPIGIIQLRLGDEAHLTRADQHSGLFDLTLTWDPRRHADWGWAAVEEGLHAIGASL